MGTYINTHAGDSQLARVLLLEISLDTVHYFTNFDIPVFTDGTKLAPAATWSPLPFQVTGVSSTQGAIAPSGSLTLPNADKVLGLIFLNLSAMSGKEIKVYEAWLNPNGTSTLSQDESLLIQGVTDSPSLTRNEIGINIGAYVPLSGKVIPRRKINTGCQIDYKSTLCGANGTDTVCEKTIASCALPTKRLHVASLSSVACSSNQITYTTSTAHGLVNDQKVQVYGCSDPSFDAVGVVYAASTYTFKLLYSHANQSSVAVTGKVYGNMFGNLSRFGGFPSIQGE